jgi:hypothetical protein
VKLDRAGTGGVGTTRQARVRAGFHVFCVTTAVASAPDDGRVAGRKASSGLTINTAAGLYETRA